MTLYRAPIWLQYLTKNGVKILRRIQTRMAIHVARAHYTVSYEVARLLAGMVPFNLIAKTDVETF